MRTVGILCGVALAASAAACSRPGSAAAARPAAHASATHVELAPIRLAGVSRRNELSTLCLRPDGVLLVSLAKSPEMRLLDANGTAAATWRLPFVAEAICTGPAGATYIGGKRQVARLDANGAAVRTVELPVKGDGSYLRVSGLAVMGGDLFVASRSGGWTIRRYDLDLGGGKAVVEGLSGCCGQLHLAAGDGVLFVAENTRHRVGCYDRQGKVLSRWGSAARGDPAAFGGCCNPMNVCVGPDGSIYTADSGPTSVKHFSRDGKFLHLACALSGMDSCVHVTLGVGAGGDRIYVIDREGACVRVLSRTEAAKR